MIAIGLTVAFAIGCILLLAVHLPRLRRERTLSVARSISHAVESRSPFLKGMTDETHDVATLIAEELRLPPQTRSDVGIGAYLCDLGLCGVPSHILSKTSEWTAEEQLVFDRHAESGATISRNIPAISSFANIIQYHHTKFESEPRTPIASRVISVAADYVRFKRSYGPDRALVVIERESGLQYDPTVVSALKRVASLV
ncbi:MAG TPA: HD domain-containing phosphohydrolase [Fimbriimonas sp.]|nr:HD domain-containing phosphohydrolase [Fimbriimonas sp.]